MPRRERGALLDAVRAGRAVDPADAPIAVRLADRELDRLARVARPARMTSWRVVHGLAAALFLFLAVVWATAGGWAGAAVLGALAVVFASSALFARRRLVRRTGLVAQSRNLNA
jgi:4-hydroxybenzoate polyprenyltransferase